ncbi:MAG: cyclic nucleotide-binding domain-containing protein [Gammaproteobacteria bacterium]|nr:cyclic nucleotide-binding domain-containing protein [Gammaproteobacteria bacterium]
MFATNTSTLAQCFEGCPPRTYSANETIVAAGDESESLFYILRGSVTVVMEDDDGHEIVLAYLNEGEFFGEIGMFDERAQRTAWVRARTDCKVAELRYERLREIFDSSPDTIFAMLRQLSLRIRDTSRKVSDLAFKDVAGRIAAALLDLCNQPDAVETAEGFEIEITRLELGRIVGCSREMASRVLKSLEDRHLVTVLGKKILVRGPRRLNAATGTRG